MAQRIVLEDILPATGARSISWGGSMTFVNTGLYELLKKRSDLEILDTFDKTVMPEQMLERRRQALLVDLFRRNIKITTAEDLSLAEALLNSYETEARGRC